MATIGSWRQHLTHFEEITKWRPINLFSEIEKTTESMIETILFFFFFFFSDIVVTAKHIHLTIFKVLLDSELLLPITDNNGISAEFETRLTDAVKTSCVMTPGGLGAGSLEYHHHKAGSKWMVFGQLGLPEQSIRTGAVWQFAPTRRLLVETDGLQRANIVSTLNCLFFFFFFETQI
jgi:hypothetical protein